MDEANNFPLATPMVMSDCYMDDILSGSESIEEVIELQHQLMEMFKTAGMHLHKWCGNLPEMTSHLQEYAFLAHLLQKVLTSNLSRAESLSLSLAYVWVLSLYLYRRKKHEICLSKN
ncbi:uncharacterized protein TNCV_2832821 [Trichonephila clavipes]|nr:uncharacterized protein TNCV_2832821 [Trichonephila clavipes]